MADLNLLLDAAFPLEPRPEFTLHQGTLADQALSREIPESEWSEAARLDLDRNWRSYSDDELIACEAAVAHLPDDAFTYYLPAFLSFAAKHVNVRWPRPEWELVGAVVFSITNRSPFNLARFKRLTTLQRAVVVQFLEIVGSSTEQAHAADAEKALARYWKTDAEPSAGACMPAVTKSLSGLIGLFLTALSVDTPPAAAVTYTGMITGVQAHDAPGGSGGYSPGYTIQEANGQLIYAFADADRVDVTTDAVADVYGLSLYAANNALPSMLSIGGGSATLDIASHRPVEGTWGESVAIDVNGRDLTVAGDANIDSRSDDPVPTSAALGVRVRQANVTFQGDTHITTYTPGYSQGLWVYQGNVNFNGATTILAQARGESTSGVYNSGGGVSRINFGPLTVSALAIHPSDNVHGIYNDNQNSKIYVDGDLDLTATSQGSTVFGVRNQGYLNVSGNTVVSATGPRSAFGIANTHKTGRMDFGGDVEIHVVNTGSYVPFGNPTGIGNGYVGTSYIHFAKALAVELAATTEAYAIDNVSMLTLASSTDVATLHVASSCGTCKAFGIRNQGGTVEADGGLVVSVTGGDPDQRYAIFNVAADGRDSTVVTGNSSMSVQLEGQIVTGAYAGQTTAATTHIALATSGSFLRGRVTGYAGDNYYNAGTTTLRIGAGATWSVPGGSAYASDFGDGSLSVDAGGVLDISGAATGTVTIDSSHPNGAGVVLADRSMLRIYSDVHALSGSPAGQLVLGAGIHALTANGTLGVEATRDPLLDGNGLVDTTAAVLYPATSSVNVADATLAVDGQPMLHAAQGVVRQEPVEIAGNMRIADVWPAVQVSADGKRVVFSGLWVRLYAPDTIFRNGFE
jgi:hypothetical protein